MPVEVIVANANPHPRLFFSVIAERYPSHHSLFAKRSVMVVHEEQTGGGIASNVDVGPAIFVQIRRHDGHAIALCSRSDAGLLADVGKRPVAVVSVERMVPRGKPPRSALDGNPFPIAIGVRSRNRRM